MITIIDYGMGNLGSIKNMLKKLGHPSHITSSRDEIEKAGKLILPGVGAFHRAMANLDELGLPGLIRDKAKQGTPLLGICLGMQLLADYSEEGDVAGLGIIPGKVEKFRLPEGMKIPHMGWNLVDYSKSCRLFKGFEQMDETRFYFVHSYHYHCTHQEDSVGTTHYGYDFTSAVGKETVYGVQFHPEKSHKFGMLLLQNFIEL